jgi:hypothetical protein
MGSDGMIYIPSFIKIGSDINKLMGEIADTKEEWKSQKPILGK